MTWLSSLVRRAATQIAENEFWLLWVYGVPLLLSSSLPLTMYGACCASIPFFWIARRLARGRWSVATPLDLSLALLLGMGLVATVISFDVRASAHLYLDLIGVIALYYGIVNSLSAQTNANDARNFRKFDIVLWSVLGIAIVMAVLGILGLRLSNKFLPGTQLAFFLPKLDLAFLNPRGFSPNRVAGAIAPMIPLGLAWAWTQPLSRRVIALMLSVFLLVALALTQSRGALIGLAVAFLLLAVWRMPKLLWLAPFAAVALIGAIYFIGASNIAEAIFVSDSVNGASQRFELWSRALYMLQDFPFTGIGLGNFQLVLNALYPVLFAATDTALPHAHNLYLQMGVDYGIPGMVAFIGLVTTTLLVGVRSTFATRGTREGFLAIGLLCGFVVFLVHSLTDAAAVSTKTAVVVWLMMGLLIALARVVLRPRAA